MKNKEIFQKALDRWGDVAQIDMAIEECSELIFSIQKLKRNYSNNKDKNKQLIENVCDEIADVEIMMKELELIFDKEYIKERKKYKMNRLEKRLKKSNDD